MIIQKKTEKKEFPQDQIVENLNSLEDIGIIVACIFGAKIIIEVAKLGYKNLPKRKPNIIASPLYQNLLDSPTIQTQRIDFINFLKEGGIQQKEINDILTFLDSKPNEYNYNNLISQLQIKFTDLKTQESGVVYQAIKDIVQETV